MIEFILYSVLGIFFIFFMNTLGAALVFFTRKNISPSTNSITLGFAAGVMIAASVWSLIIPSIDQAKELNIVSWLPASLGFVLGFVFLLIINKIVYNTMLSLSTN